MGLLRLHESLNRKIFRYSTVYAQVFFDDLLGPRDLIVLLAHLTYTLAKTSAHGLLADTSRAIHSTLCFAECLSEYGLDQLNQLRVTHRVGRRIQSLL